MSSDTQVHAAQALSQPHRLKSLKLNGSSEWHRDRVQELTTAAPLLEEIELFARPSSHALGAEFSLDPSICLPDNFLGSETPKLQRLSLHGWRLTSWDMPLLSGLTSLKISSGVVPSASTFLDALEKMPRLAELDLQKVLPELDTFLEARVVSLAHLESLKLNTSLKRVTGLLSHVSLPAFTKLDLVCSADANEDISAYSNLTSALNRWVTTPASPNDLDSQRARGSTSTRSIKSIKLSQTYLYDFYVSFSFKKINWNSDRCESRTPSPSLELQVVGDPKRCAQEVIKGLSLSDVRTVSLELPLTDAELNLLGRLPNIQSVRARGESICKFIRYINNDPAMRPAKTPGAHNRRKKLSYFRSLRSISLVNPTFEYEEFMNRASAIDQEELMDLLTMRYELGGEIEKLSIRGATNLDTPDVELIREVCVNVEWDGCVEFESDEDDYDEEEHFFEEYYDDDSDFDAPDFFPLSFYDMF
jgi:hypothetical protein